MKEVTKTEEVIRMMLGITTHRCGLFAYDMSPIDVVDMVKNLSEKPVAVLDIEGNDVPSEQVVVVEIFWSKQRPASVARRLQQIIDSPDFEGKTVIFVDDILHRASSIRQIPMISWIV